MVNERLTKVFNPLYIFSTLAVAFFGSYACIALYEQYRLCSKQNSPKLLNPSTLLLGMAISVGGVAIWTMHFVAMSGTLFFLSDSHVRVLINFRLDLTMASLFSVIFFSYCGLWLCSRDKTFVIDQNEVAERYVEELRRKSIHDISKIDSHTKVVIKSLFRNMKQLFLGGSLVAGGVCIMHYIGMLAIEFPGYIEWNIGLVVLSVIIAFVASSAALWILFRLLALFPDLEILRISSAVIMSIAVNSMHYTGMVAGNFIYDLDEPIRETLSLSARSAGFYAVIASVIFILTIFLIAIADLRVWHNQLAGVIRISDLRAKVYMNELNKMPGIPIEPFLEDYRILRTMEFSVHTTQKVLRAKFDSASKMSKSRSRQLVSVNQV